jgi:hypothetical protein
MIAKGFTPEYGVKVFVIMESAIPECAAADGAPRN